MRLALAPKATGAERAEVDVDEVEEAGVVGGARGDRHLDMIGYSASHSRMISGIEEVCIKLRVANHSVLEFRSPYTKPTHRKNGDKAEGHRG
jgi:hypothetical protein